MLNKYVTQLLDQFVSLCGQMCWISLKKLYKISIWSTLGYGLIHKQSNGYILVTFWLRAKFILYLYFQIMYQIIYPLTSKHFYI